MTATIKNRFTDSIEGWGTFQNSGDIRWSDEGGTSGGYLALKPSENRIYFLKAPEQYLGGKSAYLGGEISVYYKGDFAPTITVFISSQDSQVQGVLELSRNFRAGEWNHLSLNINDLRPEGSQSVAQVFQDIYSIDLDFSTRRPNDHAGFDDIKMIPPVASSGSANGGAEHALLAHDAPISHAWETLHHSHLAIA